MVKHWRGTVVASGQSYFFRVSEAGRNRRFWGSGLQETGLNSSVRENKSFHGDAALIPASHTKARYSEPSSTGVTSRLALLAGSPPQRAGPGHNRKKRHNRYPAVR